VKTTQQIIAPGDGAMGMENDMNKLLQDQGFKYHLLAYLVVNAILFAVNMMNPAHLWFFWPLLGWGIGLAAHGYAVSKGPRPLRRPPPQQFRR
jgi:hypothetical protein